MRAIDPSCPNFLDARYAQFKGMQFVIHTYFRQLRDLLGESGVGVKRKRTSIIPKKGVKCSWS